MSFTEELSLDNIAEQLLQADPENIDFEREINHLLDILGIDFYCYGHIPNSEQLSPSNAINIDLKTNFPTEWLQRYQNNHYLPNDANVIYSQKTCKPAIWSDVKNNTPEKSPGMTIFNEALDFSLKEGLIIPIHTPDGGLTIGSFSVNSYNKKKIHNLTNNFFQLYTIMALAAESFYQANQKKGGTAIEGFLTPREKDCLTWVAEGKTSWEISKILNLSDHTVNFHINNATKKLGAINRVHAITKAILHGEIHPDG